MLTSQILLSFLTIIICVNHLLSPTISSITIINGNWHWLTTIVGLYLSTVSIIIIMFIVIISDVITATVSTIIISHYYHYSLFLTTSTITIKTSPIKHMLVVTHSLVTTINTFNYYIYIELYI